MPPHEKSKPMDLTQLLSRAEVYHDEEPQTLLDAANQVLQKLVRKACLSHKSTSLHIELKIVPAKGKADLNIVAKLTGKEPAHIPMPLAVFTDNRNRMFEEDPRQKPLQFEEDPPEQDTEPAETPLKKGA